jgi:hypothetical protein
VELSSVLEGPVDALRLSDAHVSQQGPLLNARFDGSARLGETSSLGGTVAASSTKLRELMDLLEVEMAEGDTLQRFSVEGDVSGTMELIQISKLDASLDDVRAAGALDLRLDGPRPFIGGTITTGRLDLSPFLTTSDAPPPESSGSTGWSDEKLDLSGLQAVDADIQLKADQIILGDIALDQPDLAATVANGNLTADITSMRAFGGAWAGEFGLDGSAATPAMRANLTGQSIAVDQALKAKAPPPASPLPNQLKAEGGSSPEPVRSLLDSLGSSSARAATIALRGSLSAEVRALVGEFCQQAVSGRYPFDPTAAREVTPADFAALFGPGGRFEQMQGKLAPYVDTSTRPWRFLPVDGAPLGSDVGTLPQFQRAQAIREAFFAAGGNVPGVRMVMKPFEMDARLKEFLLDVDGQILRYDHGPQIPVEIKWPGPRGSGVVRVTVQPAGGSGLVNDGPWALFRLFERVTVTPGNSPEKFRATFDIDGRRASFDVTSSSVRNPLRLPDLRSFQCPSGL